MKQNQFVRQHQQRWQSFEAMCENGTELPTDFAAQYRQVCHDLAIARSRHYSPSLVEKLNQHVQFGQRILYQNEELNYLSLIGIFRRNFYQSMYQNRHFLWLSMAAFWGLGLFAFALVMINPDSMYYFLDPATVGNIEDMYNPSGDVQTNTRTRSDDVLMFGVYIYNNIGIAFQMFGGGALLCIGALIPLLFNSFYFGAIAAHIVNLGYQEPFFSFVITHGSFELTAIIIAGAAGCKIGYSLLSPGKFSRAYAMKSAATSVLPLIVGAFVMLVVAALIEAFFSPRDISANIKYVVGSIGWVYVMYRFYRGTRYGS